MKARHRRTNGPGLW